MSPSKEPFFLATHAAEGFGSASYTADTAEEYVELFAEADDESVVGEATAIYYACPWLPQRIHTWFPDAKMFVILRNPVDRAWSHYRKHARQGYPMFSSSFEQALREVHVHMLADGSMHWNAGYISHGLYSKILTRYANFFGNDQIKVILFEDLKHFPERTPRELYSFLNIDFYEISDAGTVYNASVPGNISKSAFGEIKVLPAKLRNALRSGRHFLRRAYSTLTTTESREAIPTTMETETRKHLIKVFEDEIRRTEDFIGRSLQHWLV